MTNLPDAALAYATAGWAVFPVEPGGKRPLGLLVPHGLKDASTEPAVIRRWWKTAPDANIGLPTGEHFDACDVDGQEGVAALAEACQRAGGDIGRGPWSLTGGGGHHLLYLATGHGNRAALLPHVDWRGKGGYVVAPPSMHASGSRYEWATAALLEAIGEVVSDTPTGWDTPLQPAPPWLVALLNPQPPQPQGTPAPPSNRKPNGTYGQRALEGEVGKVLLTPVGQRNDQLNRAAFNLGQIIAAGGLDAGTVVDSLLEAAQRIGLTEAEAEATIKSGLSRGMTQPRRLPA